MMQTPLQINSHKSLWWWCNIHKYLASFGEYIPASLLSIRTVKPACVPLFGSDAHVQRTEVTAISISETHVKFSHVRSYAPINIPVKCASFKVVGLGCYIVIEFWRFLITTRWWQPRRYLLILQLLMSGRSVDTVEHVDRTMSATQTCSATVTRRPSLPVRHALLRFAGCGKYQSAMNSAADTVSAIKKYLWYLSGCA